MNSLVVQEQDTPLVTIGGSNVVFRSKSIQIGDKTYQIDAQMLIRMIKNITQTIGEQKQQDTPYSAFVIHSLRKARSDMVSVLETKFHIHWEIQNNESIFYV